MILKRLTVNNWRSLLGEVSLGPFSERLNVVHAPNGTGKSSAFEAMMRALFDSHRVGSEGLREVRPWGRSLSPKVTVEFSEGGQTYRVEKSFVSSKSANLFRLENGSFTTIAEGRKAEETLRSILATSSPGRGLSKQEHWGLAQILWAPQGSLVFESVSEDVATRLRHALGAQLSTQAGSDLEEKIHKAFGLLFTNTGKFRGGQNAAPIVGIQSQLEQTQASSNAHRTNWTALEVASRTVQDKRAERQQTKRSIDELRSQLESARLKAEEFTKLKQTIDDKQKAADIAKERYEYCVKAIENIARTRDSLTEKQREVADLRKEIKAGERDEKAARQAVSAAETNRAKARARQAALAHKRIAVSDAEGFFETREALNKGKERLESLNRIDKTLAELRDERANIVAPQAADIKNLRTAITQRDTAEAALNASQIHLTIIPEARERISDSADTPAIEASPDNPARLKGTGFVEARVDGFGTIQANGPEGDARKHEQAFLDAQTNIRKASEAFGTDDPDALQTRRDEAARLDARIGTEEDKRKSLLDGATPEQLQNEQTALTTRNEAILAKHPAWSDTPPDAANLKADLASEERSINEVLNASDDALEQRRSALQRVKDNLSTNRAKATATSDTISNLETELACLTNDGLTDAKRNSRKTDLAMSWEAATEEARKATAQLEAISGDPTTDFSSLKRSLAGLEASEQELAKAENIAQGRLDEKSVQGTYSELVVHEEKVQDLKLRLDKETVRMEALRLLRDTVAERKQALIEKVAGPVEQSATRYLKRVAGPRLGEIKLNEDFTPQAIQPELTNKPVALPNLSGGETEQLYLIARLALADVLARDERQLVVLDDVLNATDNARLNRIHGLLAEASSRLQIIILTCHPDRHRGLDGATFIELNPDQTALP